MNPVKVLLVDDEPLFLQTQAQMLMSFGAAVITATSVAEGFDLAQREEPDAAFLDLRLPDGDGLSLLRRLRDSGLTIPAVMVSGQGTIPEAVQALNLGAVDFLVKPVSAHHMEIALHRVSDLARLRNENRRLKELAREPTTEFLGQHASVRELLTTADKVARSDLPLLLEGETGSGKQVLARYILSRSGRESEPFVAVNCAAISPNLFESEMFGHERGSFTGAISRHEGKLELVGRGTLFLDEVGELPMNVQAKLLTALEDRTFERIGGVRSLQFQGRIIAATNRDLDRETAAGTFRRDLLFRLQGMRLRLPTLRERPEDIPIYISHTLSQCNRRYGFRYLPPDPETLKLLKAHSWPGNVRELQHHVERAALLAGSNVIPRAIWLAGLQPTAEESLDSTTDILQQAEDAFRRRHIERVLKACGENQTAAAARLGVGRSYLNRILQGYRTGSE